MHAAGVILASVVQDLVPFAVWLLEATCVVGFVAGVWRTFAKAGRPGWAVLVPVYNLVTWARVAGGDSVPLLMFLLVPPINVVILGLLSVRIARRFGRGVPFGLGLLLLPIVFYPLLGFGPFQATEEAAA